MQFRKNNYTTHTYIYTHSDTYRAKNVTFSFSNWQVKFATKAAQLAGLSRVSILYIIIYNIFSLVFSFNQASRTALVAQLVERLPCTFVSSMGSNPTRASHFSLGRDKFGFAVLPCLE